MGGKNLNVFFFKPFGLMFRFSFDSQQVKKVPHNKGEQKSYFF
jgi:hypothetical protein